MDAGDWGLEHGRLHGLLRSRPFLPEGEAILMAVSGGQDSLALTQLLLDLRSRWHWRLAMVHCNHRWRSDAEANAEHVQQLAQQWQLDCVVRTADPPPRSEAEARHWRYQVLGEIAREKGSGAVVTGHTASDRAETLLYNLVRGSGADGLASLAWERPLVEGVRLVRPLLAFTRAETGALCDRYHLPIWQDSTNQSRQYARNRIRLDVLPYLREHINPRTEEHLSRTAELLQADVAYLEAQANLLRQQVEQNDQLQRRQLNQAPLALQRRVVRQFLAAHLPHQPNQAQIEAVVDLLTAPNRRQTAPFPGGAIARVEGDWIILTQRDQPYS